MSFVFEVEKTVTSGRSFFTRICPCYLASHFVNENLQRNKVGLYLFKLLSNTTYDVLDPWLVFMLTT